VATAAKQSPPAPGTRTGAAQRPGGANSTENAAREGQDDEPVEWDQLTLWDNDE
jgi:hypothetical protein